jgi:hypothetical protein
MKYEEPAKIDRADAETAFATGDSERISDALVRFAYHDPEWRWVQDTCLQFLDHPDTSVRGVAATCLGHVARIHGRIDGLRVVPALRRLLPIDEVGGPAEDALDDIAIFAPDSLPS